MMSGDAVSDPHEEQEQELRPDLRLMSPQDKKCLILVIKTHLGYL